MAKRIADSIADAEIASTIRLECNNICKTFLFIAKCFPLTSKSLYATV